MYKFDLWNGVNMNELLPLLLLVLLACCVFELFYIHNTMKSIRRMVQIQSILNFKDFAEPINEKEVEDEKEADIGVNP